MPAGCLEDAAKPAARAGQWTREEEDYAAKIGDLFAKGIVPNVPEGMTMRSLLATLLNCSPMRVSKKYSGEHAIGKRSYRPCLARTPEAARDVESLRPLEQAFHRSVRGIGSLTTSLLHTSDLPTPMEIFPDLQPPSKKRKPPAPYPAPTKRLRMCGAPHDVYGGYYPPAAYHAYYYPPQPVYPYYHYDVNPAGPRYAYDYN